MLQVPQGSCNFCTEHLGGFSGVH